ncbi:hypothetical protein PFISCL1PPCAC_26542, partial [Pristionchus fissidentatus]
CFSMATDHIIDVGARNWTRFRKVIDKAGEYSAGLDGFVGMHLKTIIEKTDEVGSGLNRDWRATWSSSDEETLEQQQADALGTVKELHKAFKALVDIYLYRQKEYEDRLKLIEGNPPPAFSAERETDDDIEDEMQIKTEEPDETTSEPTKSHPSSNSPRQRTQASDADSAGVVKEEPLDDFDDFPDETAIKSEPIDYDDIPDEKPLADMFLPSTSTSRPIAQTDLFCHESMASDQDMEKLSEQLKQQDYAAPSMMKATKRIAVKGHVVVNRNEVLQRDRDRPFFQNLVSNSADFSVQALKDKYKGVVSPSRCVLCNLFTTMGKYTPTNPANREHFLTTLRLRKDDHVAKVQELLSNDDRVFFCHSHIGAPPRQL